MKTYAYSFDQDGYYLGLCRATLDPLTKQLVFPHNSTDQEPYWKDGYQSRWDFTLKNWTLEPRGEKKHRMEVEKELMGPIREKLLDMQSFSFDSYERLNAKLEIISTKLESINENTILSYQKWIEVKNMVENSEENILRIQTDIRDILVNGSRQERTMLAMKNDLVFLTRPSFFQRLKRKLSFGFMRRL